MSPVRTLRTTLAVALSLASSSCADATSHSPTVASPTLTMLDAALDVGPTRGTPTEAGRLDAHADAPPTAAVEAGHDADTPSGSGDASGIPCNGEPRLCGLRYDQSIVLTTHLSAATVVAGWATVAQNLAFGEQLASDVPAVTLEVFDAGGSLEACHDSCDTGHTALSILLGQVKSFLEAYTLRVVTLLVESHASGDALAAAFRDAGLESYAYAHDGGATWPTLGTMVAKGTRLVTFVRLTATSSASSADGSVEAPDGAALATGAPFLEPMDRWIRETDARATAPGAIDCRAVSGDPDAPWILLHQHVVDPVSLAPNPDLAQQVNSNPVFLDRLEACRSLHGRYPTFVAVDFVELGSPQTTVRRLNAGQPVN